MRIIIKELKRLFSIKLTALLLLFTAIYTLLFCNALNFPNNFSNSRYDVPFYRELKEKFGIMGLQLCNHANGIDTSKISDFNILQVYEMINNKSKEQISGYIWKSNSNNEISIKKEDPLFSLYDDYYIVVIPNLQFNFTNYFESRKQKINNEIREFNFIETVARKTSIKFYLGISTSNKPLMITEGIPHTMTLNQYYDSQLYIYQHFDTKKILN